MKRALWAGALLTGVLALLVGALAETSGDGPVADAPHVPTARVAVVHPERGDMRRTLSLPGDVIGRSEADLYAKVTGYLTAISVDKGDWVTKGQVLAKIEVPELEQQLKRARANLAVQRVTSERLEHVWDADNRLVAREDVDIATGQFQQAKARVEELEAKLAYSQIVAPFDGVITARFVDPGALIEASGHASGSGTRAEQRRQSGPLPVLSLADVAHLRVYVYVPEAETPLVRRGQTATLTLRELPGRSFAGVVSRFANSLDLATRTMLTEVDLDNADDLLYPGMYADVTLEIESHPDVLRVPATAVGGDAQHFVFAVRDGTLSKVPIDTGITTGEWVEIRSGLSHDDAVVAYVTPALRDGAKVQTVASDAVPAGTPDAG